MRRNVKRVEPVLGPMHQGDTHEVYHLEAPPRRQFRHITHLFPEPLLVDKCQNPVSLACADYSTLHCITLHYITYRRTYITCIQTDGQTFIHTYVFGR